MVHCSALLTLRLLMPLLCKDMVDLLDNTSPSSSNHSSLSDYAFLYGVFPTAPSVAIYAVYYNAELEVVSCLQLPASFLSAVHMLMNFVVFSFSYLCLFSFFFFFLQIASGMVISTFLSAPIMYASAWLLTIHWMDPQLVMNSLQNVSFNTSIVSLVVLVSHNFIWAYAGLLWGLSFTTDILSAASFVSFVLCLDVETEVVYSLTAV